MPKSMLSRFKWNDSFTIGAGQELVTVSSGMAVGRIDPRNPLDPYNRNQAELPVRIKAEGLSHRVNGWDIMASIYNAYVVIGCTIMVTITEGANDTGADALWGVHLSSREWANKVQNINTDLVMERRQLPKAKQKRGGDPGGTKATRQLAVASYNWKKWHMAQKKMGFDMQELYALSTLEPPISLYSENGIEQPFFYIWAAALQNQSFAVANVHLEVEYTVAFKDPKLIAQVAAPA